jgi:penicillin amidase
LISPFADSAMRRSKVWVKRLLVGAGLILVAAAAIVAAIVIATVPPLTGTLKLPGLVHPVSIVRDRHAVPHITGSSVADLFPGRGFAHAQDRLWELELMRRASRGSLS